MPLALQSIDHSTGQTLEEDRTALGSWVELHEEVCRSGRIRRLLVNHRTTAVLGLDDAEADFVRLLETGDPAAHDPRYASLLAELSEGGFLVGSPQPERRGRGVHFSAANLDLRWEGANRFVKAVYDHGGRFLFHPIAVVAQVLLGLVGLAAVFAAAFGHHGVHLRVEPIQVPIILGLSVIAVAIHETAHALVVIRHGRSVDAMGFRLLFGAPAFYVEAVDALVLTRRQRILQAAAGPWAEWLVVSVVALWLWHSPDLLLAPLLGRFVILNSATIASNLLPFAGLDGSWILADVVGEPDLSQRSRGALHRLFTGWLNGSPRGREDFLLAGYGTVNGIVCAALLVTSVFFWYQLFAGIITSLLHHGILGWAILLAAAMILGRPALRNGVTRLVGTVDAATQIVTSIRFRLQWHWRIPAIRDLAATDPALSHLDDADLSVLAGHLQRARLPRGSVTRLRRAVRFTLDPEILQSLGLGTS